MREQRRAEASLRQSKVELERSNADLARLARVAESARDKADEASRLKSEFLANTSHEIRTPLNGIVGMTEMLLETDLNDRQAEYASLVHASGQALSGIINDILDFSEIEQGRLDIETIQFSPRRIVQDAVDSLAGSARSKELEIDTFVDESVPGVVGGDPGRLRQTLTSILGNAVKFTHVGDIAVRVQAVESEGTQRLLRFEVQDTGVGISSEAMKTIFEPFAQADSSNNRMYGGTGLGLAVTQRLVGLMGGECGFSSELGTGSLFWFTIAIRTPDGPPNQVLTPQSRPGGLMLEGGDLPKQG